LTDFIDPLSHGTASGPSRQMHPGGLMDAKDFITTTTAPEMAADAGCPNRRNPGHAFR